MNKISDEQFITYIKEILKTQFNLNTDFTLERHTALPNDEDEFMRLFYDEETENIKNINLFKLELWDLFHIIEHLKKI